MFGFVFSNSVTGFVILQYFNFIVYIHVAGFGLILSQTGTAAKACLHVIQGFGISCSSCSFILIICSWAKNLFD